MDSLSIVGTALGLSMDAFAVALATSVSLECTTSRHIFRFGFHFGLFQALMPTLGWMTGRLFNAYIVQWDHWVAFALLAFVGGKAVYEGLKGDDDDAAPSDPTRGWSLIALSVATSIDAFAVGLSFAMLRIEIWYPAVVIGLITAGVTSLGMIIGGRLGMRFGSRMEIFGGVVLIGIGCKILADHFIQ